MNVTLLQYDPDALDLLVMTKQTRLSFTPADLQAVREWPMEKKLAELTYMLGTIESSWEFSTYVFLITGVSRAFTHQLVRTREGSYAQQSQRTVNMSGFSFVVPAAMSEDGSPEVHGTKGDYEYFEGDEERMVYEDIMSAIDIGYTKLISMGVAPQDARGVLPTNVATAIVAKFSLRTLSHMAALRLCTRTQGEFQSVFRLMRDAVTAVHPWAEPFLRVHCARHGVCAFPHFQECPIKGPVFNPETGRRWDGAVGGRLRVLESDDGAFLREREVELPAAPATRAEIQAAWEATRYEARPAETPREGSGGEGVGLGAPGATGASFAPPNLGKRGFTPEGAAS